MIVKEGFPIFVRMDTRNNHYNTVEKAIAFIRLNYKSQPELAEVASHVNLSKYHFQKLFQEWAGLSPKTFLQYTTIEHAKKLLREGRSTLDSSLEVGLSGNGRLHDLFVKIESVSPGQYKGKGKGINICFENLETPFGDVFLAETEVGICRLSFLERNTDFSIEELKMNYPLANIKHKKGNYSKIISEYFSRWEIPDQKIILDLRGTPFQLKVWEALLTIPSGTLKSYGDIACHIDKPNASRAVGTAIGSNPIACIIPCHRVIRENGEPGGYKWGTIRKSAIIASESGKLCK